jgi:hypothetical protein
MRPADKLPSRVVCGNGHRIPIVQRSLRGKYGCLDLSANEIVLKQKQPKAGKHLILLHEMIHLAAEQMKASGIIKRQPDEKFVENVAGTVFPMLALSGLWKGVSPAEVKRFIARHMRHP